MDRHRRVVLALSVCPICFDSSGALTDGARAGALVLALVAGGIIAAFARFAVRFK